MSDRRGGIEDYQAAYLADYDFESVMVRYRHRVVLETLATIPPPFAVVEAGCGKELLVDTAAKAGISFERWVVVEPAPAFLVEARRAADLDPRMAVIEGAFENEIDRADAACGDLPRVVLISSLLHEVSNPEALLAGALRLLGKGTLLHVNVPNAGSFHRHLARSMRLLSSLSEPSPRNRALNQRCVFDRNGLRSLLETARFQVKNEGGYFVKPFTHEQMSRIKGQLGPEVMDGLYRLGQALPDLASEIFMNAVPA